MPGWQILQNKIKGFKNRRWPCATQTRSPLIRKEEALVCMYVCVHVYICVCVCVHMFLLLSFF